MPIRVRLVSTNYRTRPGPAWPAHPGQRPAHRCQRILVHGPRRAALVRQSGRLGARRELVRILVNQARAGARGARILQDARASWSTARQARAGAHPGQRTAAPGQRPPGPRYARTILRQDGRGPRPGLNVPGKKKPATRAGQESLLGYAARAAR